MSSMPSALVVAVPRLMPTLRDQYGIDLPRGIRRVVELRTTSPIPAYGTGILTTGRRHGVMREQPQPPTPGQPLTAAWPGRGAWVARSL